MVVGIARCMGFAIIACAFLRSTSLPAQEAASPELGRPKIGLVLAGGGAKGIAHVGVIKELERIGIHPDLVVGTSMGSIVGGLYATGLSSQELEDIVREIGAYAKERLPLARPLVPMAAGPSAGDLDGARSGIIEID